MNTTDTTERKPQPDKLETVLLPHKFTSEERLAMSDAQNQALEEIVRLDAEAARVSKEFNAKVKAQYATVEKLRCALKKGEEQREQQVVTVFDPTAGKKVYFAPEDTAKMRPLGFADMTPSDYELQLPL